LQFKSRQRFLDWRSRNNLLIYGMELFNRILKTAVEGGASDIHLKIATPVIYPSTANLSRLSVRNRRRTG
jgi:hypothetical protein